MNGCAICRTKNLTTYFSQGPQIEERSGWKSLLSPRPRVYIIIFKPIPSTGQEWRVVLSKSYGYDDFCVRTESVFTTWEWEFVGATLHKFV